MAATAAVDGDDKPMIAAFIEQTMYSILKNGNSEGGWEGTESF